MVRLERWLRSFAMNQVGPIAIGVGPSASLRPSRLGSPWRDGGRRSVGGDTSRTLQRLTYVHCRTSKRERSFRSRLGHRELAAECDQLIQKVFRNKYNFYRYMSEGIDAIVEHAIWGKVLRGKPHPCCASECLGCADSDGFVRIVNVSIAAFFDLFSTVSNVIFDV